MILNIIKIVLFALVNAGGYFVIPIMINLAVKWDVFPEVGAGKMYQDLIFMLTGAGTFVWAAAGLASVGYFFVKGELRTWLILAPLYVTTIYGLGVLIYFNFIPVY